MIASDDKAWKRADLQFDKAAENALTAMIKALQPGRAVTWIHGKHERAGYVVAVIGHSYWHCRVRVKSAISGKLMDIPAGTIFAGIHL